MKKVLFVLVFMIAAVVVNAQATGTTTTKSTTTTTVAKAAAVRVAVKEADLLKAITDNIAKDYVGYTIKEATSVTLNNVVTYEVVIVKGTAMETLVYDKDGKFVKKLPPMNM
jgi:hypothetical protein